MAVALILGLLAIRYSAWPVRNVFVEMGLENPPASKFFGNFFLGIKYGIFDAQTHFYPFFKEKKVINRFRVSVVDNVELEKRHQVLVILRNVTECRCGYS